uniref:Uncharacterized protein n=1 Tax=Arundo donax TaxID=35708 RepID=A0A0A8YFC6_ARUDO
MFDLGQKRQLI